MIYKKVEVWCFIIGKKNSCNNLWIFNYYSYTKITFCLLLDMAEFWSKPTRICEKCIDKILEQF